jgi:hypothetical protein
VPLHPGYPSAERILVFGGAGTSKTTGWLDIAKWSVRTNSPAKFFVLDTDSSVGRMLPSYPDIIPNLYLSTGFDWTDYTNFLQYVLQNAGPQDWVIVDFIGAAWKAVQEYYVNQVFHQDMGNYFLQARKALSGNASSLGALDGWTDWSVINPLYAQWARPLLFKGQYNLYCTAQSDQLSSDRKPTEDAVSRSLLLPFGTKPVGQKELLFQFHTVLLTGRIPAKNSSEKETFTVNTVKDRERKAVSGLPVNSFTVDYLVNIGGWALA